MPDDRTTVRDQDGSERSAAASAAVVPGASKPIDPNLAPRLAPKNCSAGHLGAGLTVRRRAGILGLRLTQRVPRV